MVQLIKIIYFLLFLFFGRKKKKKGVYVEGETMESLTMLCGCSHKWGRYKSILNPRFRSASSHLLVGFYLKCLWRRIWAHTLPLTSFGGNLFSNNTLIKVVIYIYIYMYVCFYVLNHWTITIDRKSRLKIWKYWYLI